MPYTYPEEAKSVAVQRTTNKAHCYLCRHFQKEVWLQLSAEVIASARCLEYSDCFPDAAHLCAGYEAREGV